MRPHVSRDPLIPHTAPSRTRQHCSDRRAARLPTDLAALARPGSVSHPPSVIPDTTGTPAESRRTSSRPASSTLRRREPGRPARPPALRPELHATRARPPAPAGDALRPTRCAAAGQRRRPTAARQRPRKAPSGPTPQHTQTTSSQGTMRAHLAASRRTAQAHRASETEAQEFSFLDTTVRL